MGALCSVLVYWKPYSGPVGTVKPARAGLPTCDSIETRDLRVLIWVGRFDMRRLLLGLATFTAALSIVAPVLARPLA